MVSRFCTIIAAGKLWVSSSELGGSRCDAVMMSRVSLMMRVVMVTIEGIGLGCRRLIRVRARLIVVVSVGTMCLE